MNRNRYGLCLLLCGMLLYYAVPNVKIHADGSAGIFAMAWLLLALFVIAGNLTAFLYTPIRKKGVRRNQTGKSKKKLRLYS